MHVTATGLGHHFPGRAWLFRDLDLHLRPGRTYALTGPSGSGKSTLLGLLAGWQIPREGNVERRDVRRVRWVFQNPHGTARRTSLDHVVLPFLVRGLDVDDAETAATDLLERFGLGAVAKQEFRRLSGGEAQRLMLARAFAAEPDLLLVDEPTAQLDPPTARTVNASLGALRSSRTIIIVATHDAATRDFCTDHVDLAQVTAA